jgi:hypothetical protein
LQAQFQHILVDEFQVYLDVVTHCASHCSHVPCTQQTSTYPPLGREHFQARTCTLQPV